MTIKEAMRVKEGDYVQVGKSPPFKVNHVAVNPPNIYIDTAFGRFDIAVCERVKPARPDIARLKAKAERLRFGGSATSFTDLVYDVIAMADYARFLEIKCFELAARVRREQEIGGQIAMFE